VAFMVQSVRMCGLMVRSGMGQERILKADISVVLWDEWLLIISGQSP
jgi:hypothetical protein